MKALRKYSLLFKKHKRSLIITCIAIGFLVLGGLGAIYVLSEQAVSEYRAAKTQNQAFAQQQFALLKSIDPQKLDELQQKIDSSIQALKQRSSPQLSLVWLGNLLNPRYRAVTEEVSAKDDQQVALKRLSQYVKSNRIIVGHLTREAIRKNITNESDATGAQSGWEAFSAELQQLKTDSGLQEVLDQIAAASKKIADYYATIADAYKKKDRSFLERVDVELQARIHTLQTKASELDSVALTIDKALHRAFLNNLSIS